MKDDDPNEAYQVVPVEPGAKGPPHTWWTVKRKKRGRPATGTEPLYGIRIADAMMKQIMDWAKTNGVTRSVAIRRLVELGLKAKANK